MSDLLEMLNSAENAVYSLIVDLQKIREVAGKQITFVNMHSKDNNLGRNITLAITYAENVQDKLDRAKAAIE